MHAALSLANLASTTPEYQIPQAGITEHLKKFPLALVWGGLDECHSAQFERRHGGRSEKDEVYILYIPYVGHLMCEFVDWLKLHEKGHFWHGHVPGASITTDRGTEAPMSRL
jgi:hypothetical protein